MHVGYVSVRCLLLKLLLLACLLFNVFCKFICRLENEHVNNLEGYRKVDFIPMHFDTASRQLNDKSQSSNKRTIMLEVIAITSLVCVLAGLSIYTRYS
jgi:hypothetical protein